MIAVVLFKGVSVCASGIGGVDCELAGMVPGVVSGMLQPELKARDARAVAPAPLRKSRRFRQNEPCVSFLFIFEPPVGFNLLKLFLL